MLKLKKSGLGKTDSFRNYVKNSLQENVKAPMKLYPKVKSGLREQVKLEELEKNPLGVEAKASTVNESAYSIIGTKAVVFRLEPICTQEIRDMDSLINTEEVEESIKGT